MKTILTMKPMKLAIACALAWGVLSGVASAQTNPADTGYLTDQRSAVARSGFGLCWHTGMGPAVYTAECDPSRVPAPLAQADVPASTTRPAGGRVTLDADTLFDFNKADLRPAGKMALDDFLEKMKGITPEVIIAVGHADRIGSDAYNQNLSERRATSVKTYMLGKGIAANRIHTEGRGEKQPVTKAGDCLGAKSAKVIACLQPDRRVDIEMVGTRVEK